MKKRRIQINFSNRWLYTLILVGIVLIAGIGFFTASLLSPGVSPNPGHSINQTSPPSGCTAGQVLQWTGTDNANGGWICTSSSASVPSVSCSSGQFVNTYSGSGGTCASPTPISGGLYGTGICYSNGQPAGTILPPMTSSCSCPSGYTVVTTGTYNSLLIKSCYKN